MHCLSNLGNIKNQHTNGQFGEVQLENQTREILSLLAVDDKQMQSLHSGMTET